MTSKAKRPALMTVEDVIANVPGGRGSKSTVHGWIAKGVLPSVKVGRHRLVRRADAAAFFGIAPEDLIEARDLEHSGAPAA